MVLVVDVISVEDGYTIATIILVVGFPVGMFLAGYMLKKYW
jgi:hypothetical protein